jgi:hypothetical protein
VVTETYPPEINGVATTLAHLVSGLRARGHHVSLARAAWTRSRPDAVYVATEGPLGWSALRAGAALGVPVYTGFHTNFHTCAGHDRAGWLRHAVAGYLQYFHNASAGTLVATECLRAELASAGFKTSA